jgi:phage protein D
MPPQQTILPIHIFAGQDFYAPAFRFLLGGKTAPVPNNDVISVTYQDSLTEIDSCDITVNNWDAETLKFKYSDTDTFDPWKDVELHMGYYHNGQDRLRPMLIGQIATLSPNFPSGGGSTLTVRALNLFHSFRAKQITRVFTNLTETEIAQKLLAEISAELNKTLKPGKNLPKLELKIDERDVKENKKGEEKNKVEYLVVNNQYPILFLMERARRIGYELSIDQPPGKTRQVIFRFHPTKAVTDPTYILEWGKSLISLQPNLQMTNQVSEVTVRGWDPSGKTKFEKTIKRTDLGDKGIVNPSDFGVSDSNLNQKLEIVVDRPIASKAEAENLAKSMLSQIAVGMVEAKGKTIGLPDLRAGVKIEIRGLGRRFSGPDKKEQKEQSKKALLYLVTATTHSLSDGGYTTDFTARMEKSV